MPTPKQVRLHYKKCRRYFWLLQRALNDAHNADVIDYVVAGKDEWLPSACKALDVCKKNFEAAVEKNLAKALRQECMDELKDVW